MSLPHRKAAVLGYYGFGNLGDEAVLAGIRRCLDITFDTDLLVLTNDPSGTLRLHPGVRSVDRWKWKKVAQALIGTELFILGGGSLLQDATSVKSVLWYALMAVIARRRARHMLWWGQGIGPLQSALSRQLVRFIGNQADAITVRDDNSAQILKDIGVKRSITTVADPAFALEPFTPSGANSPAVLFALRRWKDDVLGKALAGDALKLSEARPEEVRALPMHLPEDSEYMRLTLVGVDQHHWQTVGCTIEQTLGLVSGARLMVAMRLHALIFAIRCGVPVVALSYDPKVDALLNAAGQGDCLLPLNEISVDRIAAQMRETLATAEKRRTHLTAFAESQRTLALEPARIAAQL